MSSKCVQQPDASLVRSAFGRMLRELMPQADIREQVRVLSYSVDFVVDGSILVEYDEKQGHSSPTQKAKDAARETQIVKEVFRCMVEGIDWCGDGRDEPNPHLKDPSSVIQVVRVKEGEEIDGLRQVLIALRDVTMSDVCDRFL